MMPVRLERLRQSGWRKDLLFAAKPSFVVDACATIEVKLVSLDIGPVQLCDV
jgi:hypothetical protein